MTRHATTSATKQKRPSAPGRPARARSKRPPGRPTRETAEWIRNASDRDAIDAHGCWFNVRRAAYAVWWIERHCRLYEGDQAGEPLVLRGCKKCGTYRIEIPDQFDEAGMEQCVARARKFAECVKAGHDVDWQYDTTMRVFGWMTQDNMREVAVRRFRESLIYIAKKNKKSPTLAAWGMYLLVGDEEPGQKVFLAAKDGMQVRANTSKHSVEMVRQSPELSATCLINKVEMRITHEPSRSIMIPLSSSNVRTHKAKEGLNGSLLVDETHVVDREFMSRINRAGISRKEPLLAEFSTAGDDPDSYGKERFDLAERILRGDEPEYWRTFAAIFAAPQDLNDADLEADPLKWGRMANPALGHTVDAADFLEDYNKSRKSPANLAMFKMYRLNIWQNAASPWLPMTGWHAGQRDIVLDDFRGRRCWSALDLASVRDFAALTLDFPDSVDTHNLFWWFWLPAETAAAVKHLIPIEAWLADPRCNLILTPGARTDYGYIRSHFRELAERFEIMELAYDDYNAEQTTGEISEGVRNRAGEQIEPGTGVPRLNFSQALKALNEPSKRFEAAVIDGNIHHDGNPLAAWMAANATIRPDVNNNYKPLKPDGHSVKKIDGVITAVMAFWRATMADRGGSVYDELGAMKW